MYLRFSLKTTLISALLIILMLCASRWQWNRHLEKQSLIETLTNTLQAPIQDLSTLIIPGRSWEKDQWRRVAVSGTYDFEREIIVRRNRGKQDRAGFHVITPLQIEGSSSYVLVDRGFIPLGRESLAVRRQYQREPFFQGHGLVKLSSSPKLFAPRDPEVGTKKPWADLWIRVNIPEIQKQLPYPLLPIYLERIQNPEEPLLVSEIVKRGSAGRNDVLSMTGQGSTQNFGLESPEEDYPLPLFDTTPPPDIHLGYVFEWLFMALITLGICIVLQLRRQ